MPKAAKGKKSPRRRIVFRLTAPEAEKVSVLGDFNAWDETQHLMKKNKAGEWEKIVVLLPGQYEYKFLVDGAWRLDDRNPDQVENRFGTLNSMLVVSP